jgi:hypothetical protein
MSNEIQLYSRFTDPLVAIERIGSAMEKSGLTGGDRPGIGVVYAMAAMCENKSPIQVIREYHVIQGKLADDADALLAKFLAKPGTKRKIISRTPELASIQLTTPDGETQTFSFSWEEAKQERFVYGKGKELKDNWATPRGRMQMLWARVISDGVRAMDPGIACGIKTAAEIEDEPAAAGPALNLTVGPAPTPTPAPTAAPAASQAPTIVVEATVVPESDEAAEARMGLAPEQKAGLFRIPSSPVTPEPAAAPAPAATGGKIDEATLGKLQDMLVTYKRGNFTDKALAFCRKNQWIGQSEFFDSLPARTGRRITNNFESFAVAVLGPE